MNYYYTDSSNQVVGPITEEELHELYGKGAVTPMTRVVREGSEDWQKYSTVFESDDMNVLKASPLKHSHSTQTNRPRPASSELFAQSRYKDGYGTVDFIMGLATFLKYAGVILACILFALFIMDDKDRDSKGFFVYPVSAVGVFFVFYVSSVWTAAFGYILKATLDTAANTTRSSNDA